MALKRTAAVNHVGREVASSIPAEADGVFGLAETGDHGLDGELSRIWPRAVVHLGVRSNDAHTLYAVAIARSLLAAHPGAEAGVVLPAIMLHDIGWSRVPAAEVLEAIAPGGGRPDLVLLHEKEGARLAEGILAESGVPPERAARIVEIIDGHDSRREAISVEDAIVKDADKVWRLSPHGIDTVMDWFGLDRGQALRLCSSRVHAHLFTDAAKALARGLAAIESANLWPERAALELP
ncbi:HD domain-containing protein [Sinomonas sp. R1AF57]|uniref:HD domain-containing protein n=1 Tax=Sinomonas sp. R1AF57 TaxID=2020377 RepID=UPI000B5DC5BA|nr:HD domain-containing protein [Sinomonas sp. R1AF57]ASN53320.1 metal-dependent phosphohydrolase [Sinomonas sp. R1AF57]